MDSIEKRIMTLDENIQEQMSRRVIKDYVRSCIRSVILNSEDADFADILLSDWVCRYTRKGEEPFSFKEHPYQIDILNDPAHNVRAMKAAQMGISEIMARACVGKLCQHDRTKALYTLPTDDDVSIFSRTRIKPILEDSYALRQWADGTDNVGQKQIKSSFLLLRGGWEYRKMQMMDIDFLFIDELDRQKPEVIGSMRTRMDHSPYRYEYDYSTPTVEGYGIHALYEETDQKEWFITCTRCEEDQFITYENIMFYPSDEEKLNPYFGCKRCKAKLNVMHGKWKPTAKGRPNYSGYHITQAMSPMQSALDILEKRGTTYILDSDYWNYCWGLPYKGDSNDVFSSVDYDKVYGTHEANEASKSGGLAIMAIDWGHPWSWAEIREVDMETKQSRIIWIECFCSENPNDHPERMIELARNHECGMVVADIGFSNAHGYKMKQWLGDMFWDISSNCIGTIDAKYDRKTHRISCFKERILKKHFVLLSNDRILLPQDNYQIKFGKDYKSRPQLWIEHHQNIKIRKDRDGNEEIVNKGADHLALTSAYCDLAFEYVLKLRAASQRINRRMVRVHVVGH